MSELWTVIGALAVAALGFLAAIFTKHFDFVLQDKKWHDERKKEVAKEERQLAREYETEKRQRIGGFGTKLLEMNHSVNWYCWMAVHVPERFDRELFTEYEKESHKLWPEVQGALMDVAVFSESAYKALEPNFNEVIKFDSEFSMITEAYLQKPEQGQSENFKDLLNRVILQRSEIDKTVMNTMFSESKV